jgi:DNA (cytosine-5)-methyltransferase 1
MKELRIGTACSGIGSPEQAIKNLGINHSVEFAIEIDKYARETYQANHECKIMYNDITQINPKELPDIDLFVAGFPCQAFSIAGKREGFNDVRGTIFFNILEILKEKQPEVFILENVKGLLNHYSGNTFDVIIKNLVKSVNGTELLFKEPDTLGYDVWYKVLNAKDSVYHRIEKEFLLLDLRIILSFGFQKKKS